MALTYKLNLAQSANPKLYPWRTEIQEEDGSWTLSSQHKTHASAQKMAARWHAIGRRNGPRSRCHTARVMPNACD